MHEGIGPFESVTKETTNWPDPHTKIRNQITYDTLAEWMILSPLVCAFMEQPMDGKVLWVNVSTPNKDPAVIRKYFLKFPSW